MTEKKKTEKQLDMEAFRTYMELNHYMMRFFSENRHGLFDFEYRNRGQGEILNILEDCQEISQKELVSQLWMQPQSASEMLKKLEKKGLIEREKSPEDRRILLIRLTDQGRIEADKKGKFEPFLLDGLTPEEKEQFIHLLKKLLTEIKPKVKHPPRFGGWHHIH
ncbi:MAG TPA: MarR family transcriptional regulator [Ruminococcaceae bacterium]|nr:MarR family transcriptional regulator [Oscillospiraceae bacterium]